MTLVVWTFALLAAMLHVVVFVWEALLFQRPGVHQGIFFVPTADVPAVRLWAFGVGFYNLFLGSGAVAGVISWSAGNETVGLTLVIYLCLCMFLSGIVFLADRSELGRARERVSAGR
jgi:putative membrane protein